MAVLNPPRSLPGLARAVVNFLIDARRDWTEEELVEVFKPVGLNDGADAAAGVKNTTSALRAVGVLEVSDSGSLRIGPQVAGSGSGFSKDEFRRVLRARVFDFDRDGNIWDTRPGDAHTGGARDLNRALTWLLAQDALGRPLSWTDNIQPMQREQFQTNENKRWAITNDAQWQPTNRWIIALGLGTPSVVNGKNGVIPLPVVAINDVLDDLPAERTPINEFLIRIGNALPVLHGGLARTSLVAHLGADPDPGVAADCADSSVGQALRILEARGRVSFQTLPDAQGVRLSRFDNARQTHVTLNRGGKR